MEYPVCPSSDRIGFDRSRVPEPAIHAHMSLAAHPPVRMFSSSSPGVAPWMTKSCQSPLVMTPVGLPFPFSMRVAYSGLSASFVSGTYLHAPSVESARSPTAANRQKPPSRILEVNEHMTVSPELVAAIPSAQPCGIRRSPRAATESLHQAK